MKTSLDKVGSTVKS